MASDSSNPIPFSTAKPSAKPYLTSKNRLRTMSNQLKPRRMMSSFLIPTQSQSHNGMKTLVLDLDETLIHSSMEIIPNPHITFTVSSEFIIIRLISMENRLNFIR